MKDKCHIFSSAIQIFRCEHRNRVTEKPPAKYERTMGWSSRDGNNMIQREKEKSGEEGFQLGMGKDSNTQERRRADNTKVV